MHPTGIEPALKASEASVLSIRLQVQIITNLLRQWLSYHIFRILSSKPIFQNLTREYVIYIYAGKSIYFPRQSFIIILSFV